jgi:hypothetical protein
MKAVNRIKERNNDMNDTDLKELLELVETQKKERLELEVEARKNHLSMLANMYSWYDLVFDDTGDLPLKYTAVYPSGSTFGPDMFGRTTILQRDARVEWVPIEIPNMSNIQSYLYTPFFQAVVDDEPPARQSWFNSLGRK